MIAVPRTTRGGLARGYVKPAGRRAPACQLLGAVEAPPSELAMGCWGERGGQEPPSLRKKKRTKKRKIRR